MKRIFSIILALIMIFSLSVPVMAAGNSAGNAKVHTVTFKGNGHGDTLLTLKVKDGESIDQTIEMSKNPEESYLKLYPEAEEKGKTYIVDEWYTDEAGKKYYATRSKVKKDMTLYAQWIECVTEVNLTVEAPKAGSSTKTDKDEGGIWDPFSQTNKPKVTKTGANYELYRYGDKEDDKKVFEFWAKDPDIKKETPEPFTGKFEKGKDYTAVIGLISDEGFAFSKNTKVKVNGKDVPADRIVWDYNWLEISAPVQVK